MSEYRSAVDRELRRIEPLPYDVDAFHARRARAVRRRRMSATVLGVVVGGLVVASMASVIWGSGTSESAAQPITPATVSSLEVGWMDQTGASINSAPVVSGDRIYVTSTSGVLLAYPTTCAEDRGRCGPTWTAQASGSSFDVGAPGTGDGMVFAATREGSLLGYPQTCGPGICTPIWVAHPGGDLSTAAPVVADGRVYVGAKAGRFSAYAVGCSSYPEPCPALWTASLRGGYGTGGFAGAQPVVAGGVVYVGSTGGTLYAFPTTCHGRCDPLRAMELPRALANPLVLDGDTLYVTSGRELYAFAPRCLQFGATCGPNWIGRASSRILSPPAVGDAYVYVGSVDGSVAAFPLVCGERAAICPPSWSISGLGRLPNPSVVGGVLFVGSTWEVNELRAFDARCGASDGSCDPLWSYRTSDFGAFVQPTTSDGVAVFGVTGDPAGGGAEGPGGTVYAFRVG